MKNEFTVFFNIVSVALLLSALGCCIRAFWHLAYYPGSEQSQFIGAFLWLAAGFICVAAAFALIFAKS